MRVTFTLPHSMSCGFFLPDSRENVILAALKLFTKRILVMSAPIKGQKAQTLNIQQALSQTKFLKARTPSISDHQDGSSAYGTLSEFGNGGIYVANYSGFSEWERHPHGDEMVQVLEGETCLILRIDNEDVPNKIKAGELLIVPQGIWHRFESPKGVKVLTITPQPTDHQIETPQD